MPMFLSECPVCGEALRVIPTTRLNLWERYWCDKCETWRGWAEMPPEQYGRYTRPFGRHEGESLAEIAGRPGGVGYLGWAALNLRGIRLRQVLLGYLEQLWDQSQKTTS
jgi:hypothetical protein